VEKTAIAAKDSSRCARMGFIYSEPLRNTGPPIMHNLVELGFVDASILWVNVNKIRGARNSGTPWTNS
jgi:hypothetical protein